MSREWHISHKQLVGLIWALRQPYLDSSEPYEQGYRKAIADVVSLVSSAIVPATILRLRLALQSAWPYVHEDCTIESVRNEIATLMNGRDVAVEAPDTPNTPTDGPYNPFQHLLNVLGTLDLHASSLDTRGVRNLVQEASRAAERIAQHPVVEKTRDDAALQRAENQLHRQFLASILEYQDYTYDEISYKHVATAIERRGKVLNSKLAVSVHELQVDPTGEPDYEITGLAIRGGS